MAGMAQYVPFFCGKVETSVPDGRSVSSPAMRYSPQLNVETRRVFPSAMRRGSAVRCPSLPAGPSGRVNDVRSERSDRRHSCNVLDASVSTCMSVDVVTMRSNAGMTAALYVRNAESAPG